MRAVSAFIMFFLLIGSALVALGMLFTRSQYQADHIQQLDQEMGALQLELDVERAMKIEAVAEVKRLKRQLSESEQGRSLMASCQQNQALEENDIQQPLALGVGALAALLWCAYTIYSAQRDSHSKHHQFRTRTMKQLNHSGSDAIEMCVTREEATRIAEWRRNLAD